MRLPRVHRPLVVLLVISVAIVAWQTRRALRTWTAAHLAQQYQREVAASSVADAGTLIGWLASDDDRWLPVITSALADERPEVAHAAAGALSQRVEHWSQLPPKTTAARVVELARLLAQQTARLPIERSRLVHPLARRLLVWPVDGHVVDTARLIADCETVLSQMPTGEEDTRVARAPAGRTASAASNSAGAEPSGTKPGADLPVDAATTEPMKPPTLEPLTKEAALHPIPATEPPVEPRSFAAPESARFMRQ